MCPILAVLHLPWIPQLRSSSVFGLSITVILADDMAWLASGFWAAGCVPRVSTYHRVLAYVLLVWHFNCLCRCRTSAGPTHGEATGKDHLAGHMTWAGALHAVPFVRVGNPSIAYLVSSPFGGEGWFVRVDNLEDVHVYVGIMSPCAQLSGLTVTTTTYPFAALGSRWLVPLLQLASSSRTLSAPFIPISAAKDPADSWFWQYRMASYGVLTSTRVLAVVGSSSSR